MISLPGQRAAGNGCTIAGWGVALPEQVVSNDEVATLFATDDDWIFERSGIRHRRLATGPLVTTPVVPRSPGDLGTTGVLAVSAGRQALERAEVDGRDVGMVIVCTTTPDRSMPATSAGVAGCLGITSGAMDLNAVCAGFVYGLVVGASLVSSGTDRVLLIGSETMSRVTDWSDRTSAFLFGDGAGAMVLQGTPGDGALLGWDLGVDGTLSHILHADHGSGIEMVGPEVFRNAVRVSVESAKASMERAGVGPGDIDLFVPHQANSRIMLAVANRLGIGADRVASTIEHTGNTSSASIPLALVNALESGRLEPGMLILFSGFGAGMTWGSAVWRWG